MFKKLTLALLLGSVMQPVTAITQEYKENTWQKAAGAFGFGLCTGFVPVMGQILGAHIVFANVTDWNGKANYPFAAAFAAGHALGTAAWALPWYLVYRNYFQSK